MRCGFEEVRICNARESRIPHFNQYRLDVIDGKARNPICFSLKQYASNMRRQPTSQMQV